MNRPTRASSNKAKTNNTPTSTPSSPQKTQIPVKPNKKPPAIGGKKAREYLQAESRSYRESHNGTPELNSLGEELIEILDQIESEVQRQGACSRSVRAIIRELVILSPYIPEGKASKGEIFVTSHENQSTMIFLQCLAP